MAYTDQQIRDALAQNPNASPTDIYNAMQKYGISLDQLSSATGQSASDLASLGMAGGLSMQQMQDVGYRPGTYAPGTPNTFGLNALGSPAFQSAASGANSMGTTGAITAEDIKRQVEAAQRTGSDAGVLTWANANGVSADMIDSAMGWNKGSTAQYLQTRPEGKAALYGMQGYFTQGADQNAPMYYQAKQFEQTGMINPANQETINKISSQRIPYTGQGGSGVQLPYLGQGTTNNVGSIAGGQGFQFKTPAPMRAGSGIATGYNQQMYPYQNYGRQGIFGYNNPRNNFSFGNSQMFYPTMGMNRPQNTANATSSQFSGLNGRGLL